MHFADAEKADGDHVSKIRHAKRGRKSRHRTEHRSASDLPWASRRLDAQRFLQGCSERLSSKTRRPDCVVICAPGAADVEGISETFPEVTLLIGPRGSSRQRNAILRHLDDFDVVVFFDDDFVPCRRYLEGVEQTMPDNPDIVMTTGDVLADGIRGPGLTFDVADAALIEARLHGSFRALRLGLQRLRLQHERAACSCTATCA